MYYSNKMKNRFSIIIVVILLLQAAYSSTDEIPTKISSCKVRLADKKYIDLTGQFEA